MTEFTPSDMEALRKQVNEDLDAIIKRFNDDYEMWQKRTKCDAIFKWGYTGRKELVKAEVTFPVYKANASEEDIARASDILSQAPDNTITPA